MKSSISEIENKEYDGYNISREPEPLTFGLQKIAPRPIPKEYVFDFCKNCKLFGFSTNYYDGFSCLINSCPRCGTTGNLISIPVWYLLIPIVIVLFMIFIKKLNKDKKDSEF